MLAAHAPIWHGLVPCARDYRRAATVVSTGPAADQEPCIEQCHGSAGRPERVGLEERPGCAGALRTLGGARRAWGGEARHGFAGARRAWGGLGGHFGAPPCH